MDYIPLTGPKGKRREKQTEKQTDPEPLSEYDDFAGVIVNIGKSINVREMVIIWLWFLIIHSEIFIERILSALPEACTANNELTMNGTIYASFIMIIGIIVIDMVYR